MNDFVGTLIERERGAVATVTPRLPSLYEPSTDRLPADPVAPEGEDAEQDEIARGAPRPRDASWAAMPRQAPQPLAAFEPRATPTESRVPPARDADTPAGPIPAQSAGVPDTPRAPPHDASAPQDRAVEAAPAARETVRQGDPAAVVPRLRAIEADIAPARGAASAATERPGLTAPQRPHVRRADDTVVTARLDRAPAAEPRASDAVVRSTDHAEPIAQQRVAAVTAARRETGETVRARPAAVTIAQLSAGEIVPAPTPDVERDRPPSGEPRTATPVPTIHVSIGRVEIRATPPSEARPTRAPARPMSLEEYLNRRSQRGQP